MWFENMFKSLTSNSSRRPAYRRPAATRLAIEPLEDRCLLSFSPTGTFAVESYPTDMLTADFNLDGRTDLLATDLLLGNGDGTFQSAPSSPGQLWDASLVADFNRDGKPDLAGFNGVLLGNGDGTFGASIPLPPGPGFPLDLAVGDLNADGNSDLMATRYALVDEDGSDAIGYVQVLLGYGDGTFASPWTVPADVGYLPGSVVVADLDGDGNQDVVASELYNPGYLSIFLGNGDGTLQPDTGFAISVPLPVSVADFNGDRRTDLLAGSLFLGNGDGTFQAPRGVPIPGGMIGDFNQDGHLDLAGIRQGDGTQTGDDVYLSVALGRGDGTFGVPNNYPTDIPPNYVRAAAVADFNGDGFPDMAVAASSEDLDAVWAYLNDAIWPPSDSPAVFISESTVTEGHTGARTMTFTVSLTSPSSLPVSVSYATADGTAAAGSDYQAVSGTLNFDPGETTRPITVQVLGDRLGELDEYFFVNLSNPTNAVIVSGDVMLDGQGIGIILDDEPRVSISDVTKAEGKSQTTLFTFTVTLSAAYDQPVTLSFRTVNGTAKTSDNDYVAKTGTLTFNPGETTKTINIEVKGDSKKEGNETFYPDLFGLSSNALFTKSRGLGTILNDD